MKNHIKHLVFFLEGQAEKQMLKGLLQKLLLKSGIQAYYIVFRGKNDLKKQLKKRLRKWQESNCAFMILLDQDNEDCRQLKNQLINECLSAGTLEKSTIRIVCHELESWYFGDLPATAKALNIPKLSKYANKAKYRIPDQIQNPAKELEKITKGKYQKISGSRAIGKELSLNENRSHSFRIFIKAIRKIAPDIKV